MGDIMRVKLLAIMAVLAIATAALAVISYAFAYNVYGGYGVNVNYKGLVEEYEQQRGKGRYVEPCVITGTVKAVAGRTILLETRDRGLALVVVPGAFWYVEPEGKFVGAPDITELIKINNEIKVVGICIIPEREGEERGRGIGGFQTIAVGGIIIDLTANIRISRVV